MSNDLDVDVDKKHTLFVDSSDLLRDEKKKYKDWIKVAPFVIRVEIQLGEMQGAAIAGNKRLRNDVIGGARKAAEKIQKDITNELRALGDDLKKLIKDDELGVKKAAEDASKCVEAAHKRIKEFLPEFGKQVRKAVEKEAGKLSASVKSHATGSFKDIDLIYKFKGGAESYTSYHEKLGKAVIACKKSLEEASKLEDKARHGFLTALSAWQRALEAQPETTTGKVFNQSPQGKALAKDVATSGTKYQGAFKAWQDAIASGKSELDPKELRKESALKDSLESCVNRLVSLEKEVKDHVKSLENVTRLLEQRPTWGAIQKLLPTELEITSDYRYATAGLAAVSKDLGDLKRSV